MARRERYALLILAALLPACGNAPRDSGGTIGQYSPAMPLDPANFLIVVPEIALRGSAPRFSRVERDNGLVRIDTMLLPGRGILRIQYANAFFGQRSENLMRNRTAFVAWVNRNVPDSASKTLSVDGPFKPVSHGRYRAMGFTYVSPIGPDGRRCFAELAAYRFKGRTIYDNDLGEADTVIEAVFCGTPRETEEFARNMAEVIPRV